MKRLAGIFLVLVSSSACSASLNEVKFRDEVEAAYWIVRDGCAYSTDRDALAKIAEGKKRYQHHKVQALGQPRAAVFEAVEAKVDEMLSRMDIDCPVVDSPKAMEELERLSLELEKRLETIDRLLRAQKR